MKEKIKNIRTIIIKHTFPNNTNSFSRFVDVGFLPDKLIVKNVVFANLLNLSVVLRSDLPLQFNPELFTVSSTANTSQNVFINNKFSPIKDTFISGNYTFTFLNIDNTVPNMNGVGMMFSLEFVEYEKS